MTQAKLIPLTRSEAIAVTERGEEQLVSLEYKKANFSNGGVIGNYSIDEVVMFIDEANEKIEQIEAILKALDAYSTEIFNAYFHKESDREEFRKIFTLLNLTRDKLDTIKRYLSISTNALLKGNQ